jgi:hypothetical protein
LAVAVRVPPLPAQIHLAQMEVIQFLVLLHQLVAAAAHHIQDWPK